MSSLPTRIAAAVLACVAAGGIAHAADKPDPLDAPPSGLTTTTVHLSEILKANQAAVGHLDPATGNRSIEQWSFTLAGQTGTERLERSGTDYFSSIQLGPFSEEHGQFLGVRWHRDYNGFTTMTRGGDDATFLPLRVLDDLFDPKNDLSLAGQTAGTAPAYVIKVTRPQHLHPEWVFVDEKTALIARIERIAGKRRDADVYTAYRRTAGLEEPWHIHDSDGRAQLDDDWTRTSLTHPASVDPSHFVPPPSAPSIGLGFASSTALPVKTWGPEMVARMSVHGRGLDFLIDSATSTSVIDRDVAADLHLPTFGALTALPDGTKLAYTTRIDDATVGPLRLRDFALESESYNYRFSRDVRVVGVLGYDFLAGVVLHIDYMNGTAELIPHADFSGPNPVPGGYSIPLAMDDGIPMVTVGIGETAAQNVVLDTAIPFTVIFSTYMDANPAAFADYPGTKRHKELVPFADDDTYGTEATLWVTRATHIRFGPSDYQQVPVVATNFPYGDEGDYADAILGTDYLSFFDVYLDYADQRMILKPNARFYATFHKNN